MAEASTRWTTEQSGCTQPKGSQDEGASTGRPFTVSARPFKCWFTGYEPTGKDYRELYLLWECFGVELPDELLSQVMSARDHDPA
jgi:hypothetical protein